MGYLQNERFLLFMQSLRGFGAAHFIIRFFSF